MKNTRYKLHRVLSLRDMNITDLKREIERQFPDNPIAISSLSNIKNGKGRMTEFTLYRICKALHCTPNDILDDY